MFNFLRRRMESRRRAVFSFWDGHCVRRCDPMVVIRSLKSHPTFDWSTTPKLLTASNEEIALEAMTLTVDAVRTAFSIDPPNVDGVGLTELECVDLLSAFVGYLGTVKKKANTGQTWPTSTESESFPDDEAELTPSLNSDSGST
jgi:hypothetical protein